MGIFKQLNDRTDCLSGSQKQRAAIARVLLQDPAVILADKPISDRDNFPRSREIMDLFRQLSLEMGKTLVSSLHAIKFARSHYQRIIGLRQGRILFDTSPAELSSEMVKRLYPMEPKGSDGW